MNVTSSIAVAACCAVQLSVAHAQTSQEPRIHFIWMGGNDCPPCVVWRRVELPKLQASPEFKAMQFSYVAKVIASSVPPKLFLPAEVEPYKELLDDASNRRTGSPQAALMVNGLVHDYFLAPAPPSKLKTWFKQCVLANQAITRFPAV